MTQRISPKCLKGYDIICNGAGRIERNELGKKYGVPEPLLSTCTETDGLCWWVRPLGFSFSMTLKVSRLKNFWQGEHADG
ncbi:MAG: hypothetical protein CL959_01570 [Euryarchaeota archaeon]|nr:hypothetical protein [Euryarchaeota archaeon]